MTSELIAASELFAQARDWALAPIAVALGLMALAVPFTIVMAWRRAAHGAFGRQ